MTKEDNPIIIKVKRVEYPCILFYRIKDCSIGMMAKNMEHIHNNELINWGIVPSEIMLNYDSSNIVNGKPIALFWGLNIY